MGPSSYLHPGVPVGRLMGLQGGRLESVASTPDAHGVGDPDGMGLGWRSSEQRTSQVKASTVGTAKQLETLGQSSILVSSASSGFTTSASDSRGWGIGPDLQRRAARLGLTFTTQAQIAQWMNPNSGRQISSFPALQSWRRTLPTRGFEATPTRGLSDSRRRTCRPWRTIGPTPMGRIGDSGWLESEDSVRGLGDPAAHPSPRRDDTSLTKPAEAQGKA
ncbi:hypothetical protein R1flu_004018 [Riccia fluitans]|uniref:Uncharacterized protein n=1 Tax=Riccia fluitans TaxID=41844 RepID=A0ABD1YP37_9MARC